MVSQIFLLPSGHFMPLTPRVASTFGVNSYQLVFANIIQLLSYTGALNGTGFLRSDGFSESGKSASTPLRLQMPVATRSIRWGFPCATTVVTSPSHALRASAAGEPMLPLSMP